MASNHQGSSRPSLKNSEKSSEQIRAGFLHRGDRHRLVNFDCLEKMYDGKLLCDVVLVAEGMEVEAHKLILASCSAYFYWKFSEDRKLGQLNRIEIQNVTYDVLWSVVSYLYTAEILITDGNVRDLLAAAHMFGMKDLQKGCVDFLKTNLNPENCIGIRNIVERYKFEELIPIVDDYVSDHFSELIRYDEYLELSYDQISDLISREKSAASEEDVLGCVLQWIRRDATQRKGHVFSLLKHIKFSLIYQMNILRKIEEQQWLTDDPQTLLEVFKLHTLAVPSSRQIKSKQSNILVVAGISQGYFSMEMYDFQTKIWQEGPEVLRVRCERVAIHGTIIYCFYGKDMKSIDISSDPSKMVWSECSQMITHRILYSTAVLDSSIYAVGGYYNDRLSSTAEKYDTSLGKWIQVANTSIARGAVGVGECNGNLYAVGGRAKGVPYSNVVECYRPTTDSWHTMPSMSIRRTNPGVGAIGDTLFVVGGCSRWYSKAVESFNLMERTWRRLPDMNVGRSGPGVVAVNDQLYVIGGYNYGGNYCDRYLNSVEIYDPKANTWSTLSSKMNVGKTLVTAVLIDKSTLNL